MFGVGVFGFQSQRRGGLAALVLLTPLVAGCSSSSISMPSFSSMFGSSSNANASVAAGESLPMNFECPDVQVRQGASTLSSSANPAEPTALNLRYQVSIGTTARECRLLPGNVLSIKVGMEGRVILGPEGTPGPVDVPVRFAVVNEGINPRPIVTKLDRISVVVPPNDTNVLFTHVAEGIEFPMPKRTAEIDSYVIYIGFDPLAVQEPEKKKPRPKPKPKPMAQGRTS
jgi:hypothetical protein